MNELDRFGHNIDFKIRRHHEKVSYEPRAYESVDNSAKRQPWHQLISDILTVTFHSKYKIKEEFYTNYYLSLNNPSSYIII